MDEFINKLIERLEEEKRKDVCDDISCGVCHERYKTDSRDDCYKPVQMLAYNKAISIVNELAEECKEGYNLQSDKILFAYSDLLRRFRQAEESCIWELSGSIENDIKELEEECEHLLDGFNALLYSSDEYDNGWIACSERLPKEDERVLCLHSDDFIDCGVVIGKTWCCDMDEYSVIAGDVYAWMPLPVPYKPDKQQDSTTEAWKQQTMSRFERVE